MDIVTVMSQVYKYKSTVPHVKDGFSSSLNIKINGTSEDSDLMTSSTSHRNTVIMQYSLRMLFFELLTPGYKKEK